jgi:hypothetical protein
MAHYVRRVCIVIGESTGSATSDAAWRAVDSHARMMERFEQVLTERGLPWIEVAGRRSARLAQAAEAITPFLA